MAGKNRKKTRQGVDLLSADDKLFDNSIDEKEPEKSFSEMVEESFSDRSNIDMIKEKISASFEDMRSNESIKSKAYPDPQDEIDLHGLTAEEAELKTDFFIRDSKIKGLSTICIIVGKGIHSQGKAVLPDIVERKIIDLKREGQIFTFKWEKGKKHKSGAVIVYLSITTKVDRLNT